jgi:DNA helicase-2/ATP-dependent DNA helicase PcrA
MSESKNTPTPVHGPAPDFSFFLDNFDAFQTKGRGFSLFGASEGAIKQFLAQCDEKGIRPLTVRASSPQDLARDYAQVEGLVVFAQDLPQPEFLAQAARIADAIIFPLWFRRVPVCFFSTLERGAYPTDLANGHDLHRDYGAVVNALLHEQILTLLERVNLQFASPEFLHLSPDKTFLTPIEQIFQRVLDERQIIHQVQVRFGRFTVDFVAQVDGQKVIIECDGKAWHDPARDRERDKVLSAQGFPIFRFSGAEIFRDAGACVERVRATLARRPAPAYALDDDLDDSQRKAVESVNGPIRVLAPAGSGKTKTLINRILNLLNRGIPAEKILALAFNKKARDEMQERLERKNVTGIEVRTFHSLGYEIVREGLGWTFDGKGHQKTTRALLQAAVQQHADLPVQRNRDPLDAFLDGLRRAKMELPPLDTLTVEVGERIYPFAEIFKTYLERQTAVNHFDFDDMIYLAARVLLKNSALRHTLQQKFEFVLVDEFQDLNQAQLLLLQILSLPENNIFAVGDDDQMIYGFRGAQVRHIVQFDKRFPISYSHVLNTNYRSSRMVVRHSGWLIQNNTDRAPKDIHPRPGAQAGRFEISGQASLFEQARFAAEWLVNHRRENGGNWRDYAILYRYNAYQFPLTVMLDKLEIPHTPLPGQNLFKTAAGRDAAAYLQVILHPGEAARANFERILKRPNKYLSNDLIARVHDWDSLLHLPEQPSLRGWEREKLVDFLQRLELLARRAPSLSAAGCLQAIKLEFGLDDFYHDQARKSDDLDQAGEDVCFDVILSLAENFDTTEAFYRFMSTSLAESDSSLASAEASEESSANRVFLSTIHKSKGKEFRNVVYFDLSQPDSRIIGEEEERRVAYVGATRPKDDLLVTFQAGCPSPFLREMALNPKYKALDPEALERALAKSRRMLEREQRILARMQSQREQASARFDALSTASPEVPAWLDSLAWKFQDWRIAQAQSRLEKLDSALSAQRANRLAPLIEEVSDLEEESNLREALFGKKEGVL